MKKIQRLYKYCIVILLPACLCYSCEVKFEIDSRELSNAIALNGVITNEPPPYFFRLTHAAPLGEYGDGVVDAQMVITDHTAGLKDTLKLLVPTIWDDLHNLLTYYNYHSKKKETMLFPWWKKADGIYVTTKIYGIENHRYTLDILYRGEHHTAEETMIPKTPITDMTVKEINLGEKGKVWAPCINFRNRPEEENYYLFRVYPFSAKALRVSSCSNFYSGDAHWKCSILSDEYLEENVEDFVVSEGEQRNGPPGSSYPGTDSIFVCMQSISKACYDCYGEMIEQLRTDGGAYTPRPITVRSNISGGVLGLFRVSAISERYVLLKDLE